MLASLARTDPEAAAAGLELLEDVKDAAGEDPKKVIVSGLADKDPRKAFDFVMERFSGQEDRLRLLTGTVLRKLGAVIKPAELVALLDHAGVVRPGAGGGMGSIDFGDGRSFSVSGFDLNLLSYSGGEVLSELPDPATAFREMLGPEMTPAVKFIADQIARQWVEKDAAGAVKSFENTPEGPLRDMMTSALLSHASTNTDLNLLAKLEGGLGDEARWISEGIITKAVHSDFVKVLDWAEKLPAGIMQTKAYTTALSVWTGFDPAGALAWADRRPEEDQPPLYHAISDAQAKSDSYGNSEWVASLPVGHQRDAAATALIENLASKDPHSALEWAKSINHAWTQAEAMQNLFSDWMRRDPAAAWQAFQPLELRPGEKESLEQHLQSLIKR